jgi:hypothetical protein
MELSDYFNNVGPGISGFFSLLISILKMEADCTPETSVPLTTLHRGRTQKTMN